ncbi:TPA: hypothetical protein VDV13_001628 [Pseudomonas aeruginosa]|uniref:hypothetical protein n=1 Tax=Pseudomonas aeruginosa TaxID=287 RepID=UPI00157B4138|nr:hypothetical protein [Pseudomonas aeruginosa]MDP5424390.1 hypothetical protein [Pseudomonas aeruginosa]HBO2483039.1 hypothetical protein [Pseudomonas aeruginosa]HCK7375966.1 hypothetical protein [Pseudomonas aeruginosa]HDV4085076.1 hypothetical protein [Pseudomonas aeruginosa]HEP9117136.1 hypothetical protein [Pseudomonas aeruginosa]
MLLKTLGYLPFIQCLVHFPFDAHKAALKKFSTLWILTSLPVIVAVFLSPIPDGSSSVGIKLLSKLRESITVSELFVYTATFLTPVFYMIFEKYQESSETQIGEKIAQSVRRLFKGYGLVALISIVIMTLTAIAFGQIKAGASDFQGSFLGYYLTNLSLPIYIFSLFCWYLTLLDGALKGDFVSENRNSEKNIVKDFSARLRNRESDNE